jgi:hypothetical protein
MINPLDNKILTELLKTKTDGRLYKRESTTLEFKSDFNWESRLARVKYIKTIASFANRSGGYLIFGVSDSPRELVGITKDFMGIDDSVIGQFINQFISPCPDFEREEIKIGALKFGVLYIYPSNTKPVICIKDYDKTLHESAIYYRYSGQSCIIKSGDLINVLHEAKQKETDKWMQFFSKVSNIGVQNAGIFDATSGIISTAKGKSFVINEELLKRIKVLDKYSEQEEGAEAVKIIGEIDKTGTVINRPFAIHDDDIINGFLLNKPILAPKEYLEALCYQRSGFMPMYYYINKAELSLDDALLIIKKSKTRSPAKKKIISRLSNDEKILNLANQFPIDNSTSVRAKRQLYFNNIINNEEVTYNNLGEAKRLLEAICNLTKGNYETLAIKNILHDIFNKYYESNHSTFIRQTICHIDLIENS